MSRLQRWLVIGVTVVVAAFVLGLVGALTGTTPEDLVPSPRSSETERGLGS